MLFLAIKIVLTVAVAVLCYFQFKSIDFSELNHDFDFHFLPAFGLILFMPLNYFFEWKKWNSIIDTLNIDLGTKTNFQAIMAGIITGMLTPNMQGNFLGRMYYFPRRNRISIVLLTIWSNLGQLIITLSFGLFSLFIFKASYLPQSQVAVWILLLFIVGFLVIFFSFEKWIFGSKNNWFQRIKWLKRMRFLLKENPKFRFEQLGWGTLRYLVFSFQFVLAFMAFGASFSWELVVLVFQIYLWTTLAPSIILGKLVVRESIAIWVMTSIGLDAWTIIAASLSIWVINLLVPTLFGIVICKQKTIEV